MVDVPRDDDLPLTAEELLAFEMAEDNKLRSIGIDPDGDPIDIMVELDRRLREFEKKSAAQSD